MKSALPSLVSAFVLLAAAGCDQAELVSAAKRTLTAQGINTVAPGDQTQTQQHLRLMDGSCASDGNQYQYAGPGTGRGANGSNGERGGDRLRLRDGSCGNGSGG